MADEERRLGDWLSLWAHKDAHAVCAPGLTPRLGLSSWPAMYTHRREMLHMIFIRYAFVPLPLINSQGGRRRGTAPPATTHEDQTNKGATLSAMAQTCDAFTLGPLATLCLSTLVTLLSGPRRPRSSYFTARWLSRSSAVGGAAAGSGFGRGRRGGHRPPRHRTPQSRQRHGSGLARLVDVVRGPDSGYVKRFN